MFDNLEEMPIRKIIITFNQCFKKIKLNLKTKKVSSFDNDLGTIFFKNFLCKQLNYLPISKNKN